MIVKRLAGVLWLFTACDQGAPRAVVTVTFGDCAAPGSTFIVGPFPQPWTAKELADLGGKVPKIYESTLALNDLVVAYISERERDAIREGRAGAGSAALPLPTADAAGLLDSRGRTSAQDYVAGTRSPLRALEANLVACFRLQPARHGHVLFDLAPGSMTVQGIDHAAFARCVGKLAAKLPAGTVAQRCPAVFGPISVADLPGIDITVADVKLDGATVADTQALLRERAEPWWKIPAVVDAVSNRTRSALTQQAPIARLGPLVVRAEPDVPMKVVNAVIHSAANGGGDMVLASRRGADWKLVRDRPLPFPAVLAGTGGRFAHDPSRETFVWMDNPNVKLSVLVGKDTTSLGLSRLNEFSDVQSGDLVALEQALRTQKESVFFADRHVIEIAGADDVTYAQVVDVIDLATRIGFYEWTVTSPVGLTAQHVPAP